MTDAMGGVTVRIRRVRFDSRMARVLRVLDRIEECDMGLEWTDDGPRTVTYLRLTYRLVARRR